MGTPRRCSTGSAGESSDDDGGGDNNIRVAVRVRPFLPFEAGSKSCIEVLPGESSSPRSGSNDDPPPSANWGRSVRIGGESRKRQSSKSTSHNGSGTPDHRGGGHTFTFDQCFSGNAGQGEVYGACVKPLLDKCLEGYNATVLAYGQTGAGKTYTTMGPSTSAAFFERKGQDLNPYENDAVGILPRALRDLFHHLEEKRRLAHNSNNENENENENSGNNNDDGDDDDNDNNNNGNNNNNKSKFDYRVKLQFLELYGETINDLLSPALPAKKVGSSGTASKIIIRDAGGDAEALGATESIVESAHDAMVCLTRGMLRRVTGATAMNAESSRSHAMMSVLVEQVHTFDADKSTSASTSTPSKGKDTPNANQERATVVKKSKFNFVDLAGSERQKRTNAKGQRLKEGININKGLLVLGNVISALASGERGKFVPFRDSKLTRLLRGSLGGNHKTLMIACASPSHKNAEESLNCLRYANRAKNIQNRAVINVDPHSKLVNSLRGQVAALAGELLRLSRAGEHSQNARVDNDRFGTEALLKLTKGEKEANIKPVSSKPPASAEKATKANNGANALPPTTEAITVATLASELERVRLDLKEAQRDLFDRSEQLEAVVTERDDLKSDELGGGGKTPARSRRDSLVTPSKARGMGMGREESIREILTTLSSNDLTMEEVDEEEEEGGEGADPDATATPATPAEGGESFLAFEAELSPPRTPTANKNKNKNRDAKRDAEMEEARARIEELEAELRDARSALDRSVADLEAKSDDIDAAWLEAESLRDQIRNTPDVDDETIQCIVEGIVAYDEQRMEDFRSEDERGGDDDESHSSMGDDSYASSAGRPLRKGLNEGMSTFASGMFSTGKFLVDRESFQESIPCFEVVLEVRRELYGWDDPLVGDALHMEGFVRSKMGDYDRALMLLWDALRIRKIASEPLKISATLRLLADLHFSKEENMHAALFYEECARHLKDHDMKDPHLPLVLIDLARTKDRLGEYSESMNYFEEALSLYESALDHDDDRIASLQYEMGVLAFQMGDRERGESCFRHFIRIRKKKGGSLDEGVANALFVLGSLHWATKKRDLANDCWIEALDIFKGLGRTDDDPYVKSLKEKINRAQRRPIGRAGFIQKMIDKKR